MIFFEHRVQFNCAIEKKEAAFVELKERIEKVLSEILSDKYDANITIRFVPKDEAKYESCKKGGEQCA